MANTFMAWCEGPRMLGVVIDGQRLGEFQRVAAVRRFADHVGVDVAELAPDAGEAEKHRREINGWEARCDELGADSERLRDKVDLLIAERGAAEQKAERLKAELEKVRDQRDAGIKEKAVLRGDVERMTAAHNDERRQRMRYYRERGEAEAEAANLKANWEREHHGRTKAEARVAEIEAELDVARSDARADRDRLADAEKAIEPLEELIRIAQGVHQLLASIRNRSFLSGHPQMKATIETWLSALEVARWKGADALDAHRKAPEAAPAEVPEGCAACADKDGALRRARSWLGLGPADQVETWETIGNAINAALSPTCGDAFRKRLADAERDREVVLDTVCDALGLVSPTYRRDLGTAEDAIEELQAEVARLRPLSHCEHGTPFSEDCTQCEADAKPLLKLVRGTLFSRLADAEAKAGAAEGLVDFLLRNRGAFVAIRHACDDAGHVGRAATIWELLQRVAPLADAPAVPIEDEPKPEHIGQCHRCRYSHCERVDAPTELGVYGVMPDGITVRFVRCVQGDAYGPHNCPLKGEGEAVSHGD